MSEVLSGVQKAEAQAAKILEDAQAEVDILVVRSVLDTPRARACDSQDERKKNNSEKVSHGSLPLGSAARRPVTPLRRAWLCQSP